MAKFRKPQTRKQGLKVLYYGENGAGKSVAALSFPDIAVIDSESKIGVYENNAKYSENILAIADTSSYHDCIELLEEVVKNPKVYKNLAIDSMTKIYAGMQVSLMELEEERAKKKGGNVDDATVSQRGWGKIKLNSERFDNYIAQASAQGINVIMTAHKSDITQDAGGGRQVKIGEKPDLRKNSEHLFDVIVRFYKEKDIVSGEIKYKASVEKDTTGTYKVGTVLDSVTYESFKGYIESNAKADTIVSNYDKTIDNAIDTERKEQETADEIIKSFTTLFKELSAKDEANKTKVAQLLKDNGIEKYNDPINAEKLKVVIEEMKKLK